jgi:N-acetylmuramoyl-L-alanine amidase
MTKSFSPARITAAAFVAAALMSAAFPLPAAAQSVRNRYEALQKREHRVLVRIAETDADAPASVRNAVIREARQVVAGYEALVRRYHLTGYADNALWNAAIISEALFEKFNEKRDYTAAVRYRNRLIAEYPTSSLVRQAKARPLPSLPEEKTNTDAVRAAVTDRSSAKPSRSGKATLVAIDREVMPEAVRIILSLDREVSFREERISGPDRLFFDLKDVQLPPWLVEDGVIRYAENDVRQIRVGRHPNDVVRVVLDLEGITTYSVFTLYGPFRIVVDCVPASARLGAPVGLEASASTAARPNTNTTPPPGPAPTPTKPSPAATGDNAEPASPAAPDPVNAVASPRASNAASPPPVQSIAKATPDRALDVAKASVEPERPENAAALAAPPAPARSNSAGGFSLSRQLGLGVSRIVIDPGHGGRDPGAIGKGLSEAELTLDIALRLEKLLLKDGLEVVLTRRTDVYVPLEERTAIANRENADLFLSIHANASRNPDARGVETYFLSFASSPDAEAVAARENSASADGMHKLPDIIKAIALNNKLDESRDFAQMVQEALVSRLRVSNKSLRNLGVKKAPFVVLIGASMPSVLAEISFLTNRQELQLLKTNGYRQRIAEALHASVMRYRRALKGGVQTTEQ